MIRSRRHSDDEIAVSADFVPVRRENSGAVNPIPDLLFARLDTRRSVPEDLYGWCVREVREVLAPGRQLQILTDSAQNITGAVWTGVLPKARFVELPFLAMNPRESALLSWPVYETYQGGERVEWTNPDTASNTPVSSTLLTAPGVALRPRGVDVNP